MAADGTELKHLSILPRNIVEVKQVPWGCLRKRAFSIVKRTVWLRPESANNILCGF
jgi:hypothetical protein